MITATVLYTHPGEGLFFETDEHGRAISSRSTVRIDRREVQIRNGRLYDDWSLDEQGIRLIRQKLQTPLDDWIAAEGDEFSFDHFPGPVIESYFGEMEELLRKVTGAVRVIIFSPVLRLAVRGISPAFPAHADFTENEAIKRVHELLPEGTNGRFALIQAWRPLFSVGKHPLGLIDNRTVSPSDLMVVRKQFATKKVHDLYRLKWNPDHRWFYFPNMNQNEVLVFKGYDSDKSKPSFTPHCAFVDPDSLPDAPERESVDVRALALFE